MTTIFWLTVVIVVALVAFLGGFIAGGVAAEALGAFNGD
jgi:hypothetical protein